MERTNEQVLAIANTINQQISWSAPIRIQWCWGISKRVNLLYKDMPTLGLKVNGFLHKGWVFISLNEGKDTYEVRLMKSKEEVKRLVEDVYCDNLGSVLDGLIEKAPETSEDVYQSQVETHYKAVEL